MSITKKFGVGALLVAAVLLAIIFSPSMSANVDKTKSEIALDYISQKHVIPKERLKITNEKEANFPVSNRKIWSVNILDSKGKEFYYIDLDEAGNVANIKAAKAQEYAKYREKYGKKEIALHEKLQKMNPDDTVEVGIWLSPVLTPLFPERGIGEQEYKEILDAKRKVYAEKEKPVLDILKAKNINIRYASQYAPLIYAEVPAELMAEVEKIPDVDGIYLAREFQTLMNIVNQTVNVQPVWNEGITGSGVNVSIVEAGAINFSNPWLIQGSYFNPPGSPWHYNSTHTTEVAGIIAGQNTTYQGISYGAPGLLSANAGNSSESNIINASEWAINKSAHILSNSWGNNTNGTMSGIDKYFDHVVWEHRKTVTVAAGNNEQGENWKVLSPGLGYNVITVGGFEDNNTGTWSDDKIWPNSDYVNPNSRNDDREKPEVAAVATHNFTSGTHIMTTRGFEPWIARTTFAGTSYAAPAVAAEAALLMQMNNSLKDKPETIKAIIMASAVNNVDGDSRLSEKDGAGGIDISSAYDKTEYSHSNVSSGSEFPKHFNFSAAAGQRVRTVIAWDSHPDNNSPPVNDDLKSDMNLVVYGPSGSQVGVTSNSFDNSYEIVEFVAPETGTYDAKVDIREFNGPEYLGFAKTALPSLSGWNYTKVKTITGTTAGAQTNYQMKLTVYKGSGTDSPGVVYLGGNVKDDFGDLRFTKSDGVTLLDYWIESYTSGVSAVVWVEADSIPASPNNTSIYLYYGNPSATSASNGAATFMFFDDFENGLDWTNKWQSSNQSLYSVSAGRLIMAAPASVNYLIQSKNTYNDFVYDARLKLSAPGATYSTITSLSTTAGVFGNDPRMDLTQVGGVIYLNSWDAGGTTPADTWFIHRFIVPSSGNAAGYIYSDNYTSIVHSRTNTPGGRTLYVGLEQWQSGTGYVDWVHVRKYASPEPAWG